jgi:hypothetical protein
MVLVNSLVACVLRANCYRLARVAYDASMTARALARDWRSAIELIKHKTNMRFARY